MLPKNTGRGYDPSSRAQTGVSFWLAGRSISGHSEYGIEITSAADNNRILGNYIGTDITGNVSLPNNVGIGLTGESAGTEIGGPAPGEGNVITGVAQGILLQAGESLIRGNRIGTNAAGTAALVNGNHGILHNAGNTTIGGPTPAIGTSSAAGTSPVLPSCLRERLTRKPTCTETSSAPT